MGADGSMDRTRTANYGGTAAAPRERLMLSTAFERNQQLLSDLHEEITNLDNALYPVLAAAPAPAAPGAVEVNKRLDPPIAFVDRFEQQHDTLRLAVHRLRELRERLLL